MSTFDFIDTSNLFDNSGDWSDGYDIMLDLEDITNPSDDEKKNLFLIVSGCYTTGGPFTRLQSVSPANILW